MEFKFVSLTLILNQRGVFVELFHHIKYQDVGIRKHLVQDNYSSSIKGTLRGLHYQLEHPQAKLISVINGVIFDVAVDIRKGSDTFSRWVGTILSSENRRQLYIPEGFAHGFCVLSEVADVIYKCSDVYYPEDDHGILWSDSEINIDWPVRQPRLSSKDSNNPALKEIPQDKLPTC